MKVKAIRRGFQDGVLRESGSVFEIEEGASGSWFVPVKNPPTASPPVEDVAFDPAFQPSPTPKSRAHRK